MTLFQTASIAGILGTLGVCVVHFLLCRPWRGAPDSSRRDVLRFSLWERIAHAATTVGFVVLAVTGFYHPLLGERIDGWLLMIHTGASGLFFAGLLALGVTWAEDCCFRREDLEWFKAALRGKGPAPAGRFDGLQKFYFWLTMVLGLVLLGSTMFAMVDLFGQAGQEALYQIHRWSALGLLLATIVHVYHATIGQPGTWRAMVDGHVSREWLRRHHPGERPRTEP